MTTTVLLDLDDTLLGNDMNKFLPPYFATIHKHLQPFIDGKDLPQLMIASVQVMLANQDPTVTNMTAFMADFVRRLGHPIEAIQPALDTFYQEDYPHLQTYTTYRPTSPKIVRRLLAGGHQVVIATNPLFPEVAITQRMDWAGISGFPYALVTTMENSHFSKPNPKYYQEILAKTNSSPETTWMVGNNPEHDIAPAHELGINTWWITNDEQTTVSPLCNKQGSLTDFSAWVRSGGLSQ
jgi:FMN phosphatase YigB (HAD superfamily)